MSFHVLFDIHQAKDRYVEEALGFNVATPVSEMSIWRRIPFFLGANGLRNGPFSLAERNWIGDICNSHGVKSFH